MLRAISSAVEPIPGTRPLGSFRAKRSCAIPLATRKEAQDKLRTALRDLDAGLNFSAGRQTVAQYMMRWLAETAKPKRRPSTYKSYVRVHIIPELGRYQLTQLTPQHVQAFLNKYTAAGLSPRTVQYIQAILRRALGQVQQWGLVNRNVAALVDPPRTVRYQVQPVSPQQARAFIDHTHDDRLGPLEPSNVIDRLHRILADAGLPRQRFHDLRHCSPSLLLAGGVAPRTIMGILGHSLISLTMNTYAHLSPARERDVARALDAVLAVNDA